jgi:hypothetical protein
MYSIGEVIKILDIPRERLNDWIARDYVRGSVKKIKPKRVFIEYTTEDIYYIALFKNLIESLGISREKAAAHIKQWQKTIKNIKRANFLIMLIEPLMDSSQTMYVSYDKISYASKIADILDNKSSLDTTITTIVDFRKIKKEVDKKIKEIENKD